MPTLSVCMAVAEPPERVAAILAPLRDAATEIVLALDSAVTDPSRYASLADTVVSFEFVAPIERALPWLFAQCTGDWILRLDGDELVSPDLVDRLPALVDDDKIVQYFLPRRWIAPGFRGWWDEWPWAPDFQNRLVRNDGSLWVPGRFHSNVDPASPAAYLEEPIYHLITATSTEAEREAKCRGYAETERTTASGLSLAATERYYLPERHALRRPRPLPARDVAAVAAVVTGRKVRRSSREIPFVQRRAIEALWPERTLRPAAYRATVAPLDTFRRLRVGDDRPFRVRVTNDGRERWPGAERRPLIVGGYRWLAPDGSVVVGDTNRTTLPQPVGPKEQIVLSLTLVPPAEPGDYLLVVDLVHEGVRWFDVQFEPLPFVVLPVETPVLR